MFILSSDSFQILRVHSYLELTRGNKTKLSMLKYESKRELFGISKIVFFPLLWSLLLIVPGIIKALSYSMSYYIMEENPNLNSSSAIKQSEKMMNGHKLDLFILILSFSPWILLGIFTFGLVFIYVDPYIHVTIANFYLALKKEQNVEKL